MQVSIDTLQKVLDCLSSTYAEARYHSRIRTEIAVSNGEVEDAKLTRIRGVAFRVLVDGAWGFSSTNDTSTQVMKHTLRDALKMAKILGTAKKEKITKLAATKLARGVFKPPINDSLEDHSIEEKMKLVIDTEAATRQQFDEVKTATCRYGEIIDRKLIVNTDGALVEIFDSKPEFRVTAIASRNGDRMSATETVGVTGGWMDLFEKKDSGDMARRASETAKNLLNAKLPKGERATVILDPSMVGLISHEAIGHIVEADFVLSGSILRDKIGEIVASRLVTLTDSGSSDIVGRGAGTVLVDDEGVTAGRTVIINEGILRSYLHSRETAEKFGVEPTGNARAFEYCDEPIVRMRNTYISPGDYTFEEMVHEIDHGYLLKGPRSGQADANGEFMFGAQEAYLIKKGEVKEILRGVSISGKALEVQQTVDALSKDFAYGIGAGYCGKKQPAKVDGGGPYLRCSALIGGMQ